MEEIRGHLNGDGQKHAVLTARWNDFITSRLLEGALNAFETHGVEKNDITVVHIPGCFEIGPAAKKLANTGKYDAITCIGAVIRGSTPHFEYIAAQSAQLVARTAYESGIPVIYGILTTDTIEQAIERAGSKAGNKGYDAAVVAIEMSSLYKKLS